MSGVKGRSGRRTPTSVMRKCNKIVQRRAEDILEAYINKAVQGDSACLIDLANRLMGKPKIEMDVGIEGFISGNKVAQIYKAAYEQYTKSIESVKQLPQSVEPVDKSS